MIRGNPEAVLARGRRAAEKLMVDTGRFDKVDPDTPETTVAGVVTPNYLNPAPYTGKVRVQELGVGESQPEAGGHVFTFQDYRVDVPVGSFRPEVGMVYTHLTSVSDPFLAGRVGRVTALLHKTDATAYRLRVSFEEV